MSSNPFETTAMEQGINDDAPSLFEEAGDLLGAAQSLKSQARIAQRTGNHAWMAKIQDYAREIGEMVVDFLKRAIVIAAAKFVLEMCALLINQIMDYLGKRGSHKIEISTPNVHYVPNGQAVPGGVPPTPGVQRGSDYSNPFANVFSSASPF